MDSLSLTKHSGRIFLLSLALVSGPLEAQSDELALKAAQAQQAMDGGRFDEAITLYAELSQALPEIAGLKMNLGMAHFLGGHYQIASAILSEAVAADAGLDTGWLLLGASYMELGKPDQAVPAFEKYIELKPDQQEGLQMLSDALIEAGRYDMAIERLERLAAEAPGLPRVWYSLGRAYEAAAGRAFEKLEEVDPQSGYWFSLIAASRVAQQQYTSAFFFYRKALERLPHLRGVHTAISRIYRESGHDDWAEQEQKKEIELGAPDCEKEELVCAFLGRQFKEIMHQTREVETGEALYWRTQAANQLSIEAFSKLSELPASFESHQLRADIHRNQKRHWESVKEWRAALKLSPGNRLARQELALSLYLNRDYDAAKELIDELLNEDPDSSQLNFLAGDILLYEQRVEESVPFLEKALQADPNFIGAHSSLGRALTHMGESAKAIPHLEAALKSDADGSLHYQLARAYQKVGRPDLARETMVKYQEIKQNLSRAEDQLKEEAVINAPE